jgi:hypothetical protein
VSLPDGSLAAVIEHRPADDLVALIEAAAAQLDDSAQRDHPAQSADPAQPGAVPLTALAERLTALHSQLQSALSELDRV